MSLHTESPVGIVWPSIVTLPEYISVCSEDCKIKTALPVSLSLTFSPSLTPFSGNTAVLLSPAPLLEVGRKQSALPLAYRNAYSNKGRGEDEMTGYLWINMEPWQKQRNEKKKIVYLIKRWPCSAQPPSVNPGLFLLQTKKLSPQ